MWHNSGVGGESLGSIPGFNPWVQSLGSIPGSGRSPGGGNGNLLMSLPREFKGQRNLVGYSL